jgi:ergothioneine biosynthesis protein EgtB
MLLESPVDKSLLDPHAAGDARGADASELATLLRAIRGTTLSVFADYERARPALTVPQDPALNPPLWELGHVGWFQEFWTVRSSAWRDGERADPGAGRSASLLPAADALYDSSTVPHQARWSLPLPDADATRALLAHQLERTLHLLQQAGDDDDSLYFFRLSLLHEAMHVEAARYMAQALGITLRDARPLPALAKREPLAVAPQRWLLGSAPAGFAFDNERPAHMVALDAFVIDATPVRWREFLPFVEAGGYAEPRWWTPAGAQWLRQAGLKAPRYLRQRDGRWEEQWFGRWQALALDAPACHLSCHEAEAWCAWAGRRLPTEAEWECAAISQATRFDWGSVWEWTATPFAPYPGFTPHPYRDYSQPWFGTRRVMRGASCATHASMRNPRYRNFFEPERNDIHAGFRSCARAHA